MGIRVSGRIAAILITALTFSSSAFAQDNSARADEPSTPTPNAPTLAPAPPPDAQPGALAPPPMEPVPVPNPSPVVVAGKPTAPGRAVVPLEWKRTRVSTADFVIMMAGGAITLATAIIKPQAKHSLNGPILFDNAVRNALRPSSLQARFNYRDASDVGLSLTATWPFFVDALITAWWYRGSRDVAEQMALVGLETLAVSGAIQGTTDMLVSRERPYGPTCGNGTPSDAIDCTGTTHYRSFFSGHSAFSFTGAALVCFNHIELELLGGPWDVITCAGAYGVAAATATFRVVGDMHYASDVITGALVGSLVGYGIPLLHFKHPDVATVRTGGMTLRVVPSGVGAGVVGIF